MANPWSGEVTLVLDGEKHTAKLTLGALAELESELGTGTLVELVQKFEEGGFSARDIVSVIVAGLRGGGWNGTASELLAVEIEGGPVAAARSAGALLARAFATPA